MKKLALLLVLLVPGVGRACSIPVFRYALERWELSPYEITVFYEKQLAPHFEELIKTIEAGGPKANLLVKRVDLNGKSAPEYPKLWARQPAQKQVPWLVAWRPDADASLGDAWSGPLTAETVARLLDSPVRRQLVEKLSHGSTALFLLLPGPDGAANAKALALLDKELPRLAQRVQLPEPSPEGPQIRTGVPLKIEFEVMSLKRDDPAEAALIQSLLSSEKDLVKVQGPIVFPVFGRGRVLCSLFGQDLSTEAVEGVVRFLCGECSCQLKELNPGTDLLIAADWHDLLEKSGPPLPRGAAPQTAVVDSAAQQVIASAPSTVAAPAVAEPPSSTSASSPASPSAAAESHESVSCCPLVQHFWLTSGIAGAGVLVLVTGLWALLKKS